MRSATEKPIAIRVVALAAASIIAANAILLSATCNVEGPGQTRTVVSRAPPPAVNDPLNRGILIEGGILASGGNEPDTVPEGPFATYDEGFGRHEVTAFWMQEHEVTNEEYRRFDPAHEFPAGQERYPVVNVTWREALEYAVSVGGRLPTEGQWEFAARGAEGRKYPWGDSEPTCERAQFRDCGPRGALEVMARPAGATPEGIHDLAGNVWEWVLPNWFDPGKYPVNDESRRARGGSFDDDAFFLRASNRSNDFMRGFKYVSFGFRVVWPSEGARDR